MALLHLEVGGTSVLAGIVLWVWSLRCVGVASCMSVLSVYQDFLYLSVSRWYALMEIQLFTAVVLRMFDLELMDPIPTVVSPVAMVSFSSCYSGRNVV